MKSDYQCAHSGCDRRWRLGEYAPLAGGHTKRPPTEAALDWLWRVHGSLNFVRKAIKVLVQSVVHLELGLVRCQVPDHGGGSCILAEFFD
jgi:hypothetical protein